MKFSSLFWPRVLVTADHAKLVFGQSNYATLDSYELEDFSTFLSGIFCATLLKISGWKLHCRSEMGYSDFLTWSLEIETPQLNQSEKD